ncbi:MAG: glycosyltransferase [Gammaproteobacteria bacterium]|nr:glycosyltransferase [Gammaproteobacteria bacterium]
MEQSLRNTLGFCDRLLVADNGSRDRTWDIVTGLAAKFPHLEARRIDSPAESQRLLEPFIGTPTWVLGVDGDEIYDPAGLAILRESLRGGAYADAWQVFGNVLNCTHLETHQHRARGHLAPPCRSMTKLFNFAAIDRWEGTCPERLHGGTPVFRAGFGADARRDLYRERRWEESEYRCLHTCFLRRSSLDEKGRGERTNIMERRAEGPWRYLGLGAWRRRRLGLASYKRDKYRRGPEVSHDVSAFFPDAV